MVIESATFRNAIDLFYSFKKSGFEVSDIRLSYIDNFNKVVYRNFDSISDVVNEYRSTYRLIISARKDPFTTDRNSALTTPIVKNGVQLFKEPDPINSGETLGLCAVGKYVSVESCRLVSTTLGFEKEFILKDVSDSFVILKGHAFDIRREKARTAGRTRFENKIKGLVALYQKIGAKLLDSWSANLYVDLCYVNPAYVEDSLKVYKYFFPIIKRKIDSGLTSDVLDNRWFKKIPCLNGGVEVTVDEDIVPNFTITPLTSGSAISTQFHPVLGLIYIITNNGFTPSNCESEIQLTDQSTGNVLNWEYKFGNGDESTEQNPTYTYDANDLFAITLTASNLNESVSITKWIYPCYIT